MKASNLILAITVLFFSPVSFINAQQDIEILAKIDESEDYREQKKHNPHQYANLWRANLQLESSDINSRIGFKSNFVNPTDESNKWLNLELTDDGSALISLPFDFEFFGDAYSEIWVNANGNISFNESVGSYTPEDFPIVVPMIAPFWTDLVQTDDDLSGVFVRSEKGRVHILWKNMKINTPGVEDIVSFELILQTGNDGSTENVVISDSRRPRDNDHQGDGNKHITIDDFENSQAGEHQGGGHKPLITNHSKKQKAGEYQGDGNKQVIISHVPKPQGSDHQGDGNKHVIINYYEMSLDVMPSANGITPLNYMAGINSGKKKRGYHSFDLSETSIVAYVTK